jgi:DNA-binding LacI/PurR family transcriptional regulator
MPVTIHDLARLAGLNASTISRALRNDPRVKEETRELIRGLARQHGYTPNLPARQLAAGKTGNIWFAFGSPQAAIELEAAMNLNHLVTREKYDLQLVLHTDSTERFRQFVNKLYQKVADGAMVIPPGNTDACAGMTGLINSLPIPLVMIDRYWEGLACPVVTSDSRTAIRRMIDRCVEWGAKAFYLEYPGGNPVSRNRDEAARRYLKELRLPVLPYPKSNRIETAQPAAVLANVGNLAPEGDAELYGAFFDSCRNSALRSYRNVIVCRQDFAAIAERAAAILFTLLRDPAAKVPGFTEVPPQGFTEL